MSDPKVSALPPPKDAFALTPPVSLDNCEREPIHIPGSIQPHGALLAFDLATGAVLHASGNLGDLLPLGGLPVQGRALADLVGPPAAASIEDALRHASGNEIRHHVLDLPARPAAGQTQALEACVHSFRGVCVVELEPVPPGGEPNDWMQPFGDAVDAMRSAETLADLVTRAAHTVKRLTGFDRVMVYRFDEEWNGQVVADAREEDMESYLDLHYPASDIPSQARELYRRNLVRYIADVEYTPVHVLRCTDRAEPLDMSHAVLRSVSPMHLQYLRNMGVRSTLTLSLLVDGRLWGLIACHHREPTALPLRLRRASHALAASTGFMVGWNAQRDDAAANESMLQAQASIVDAFNQVEAPLDEVVSYCTPSLLRIVGATGGAFWRGDTLLRFGQFPEGPRGDSVLRFVRHAFETKNEDIVATEHATLWPALQDAEMRSTCGVMAVKLDGYASSGIVWVRPEYRREVAWGGDPEHPAVVELDEHGQPRLSPRTSFARWQTLVSGNSRPWTAADRRAAQSLMPLQQVLVVRDSLAQLSLSNRRFRGLVALQSDAYWQLDARGSLVALSKPLPTGHAPQDGEPLVDLLRRAGTQTGLDALAQALGGQKPFRSLRLHGLRIDGGTFDLSLSGEPLRDEAGRTIGWHGTISDNSTELAMQAALRQKEAAELANLAKSRFLSQISHELRTPLNAVLGFSELLLSETALSEAHRAQLRHIHKAGEWLLAMISDLLDLSRIETGNLTLNQRAVDVNRVLDESVALLQQQAAASRVHLFTPAFPRRRDVRADPVRLKQVMVNLISNAVKYNRPGGEVRLEVVDGSLPDTLTIRVHDTGAGLTEQQCEHLFEPFNRLGREGQRIQGTGIGLVIAKQIVEAMGGAISVTSTPGMGSCFSITLAAAASEEAHAETAFATIPGTLGAPTEPQRPSTVLYVEDEPTNVQLMKAVVESIPGAEFAHAESAEEGWAAAQASPPGLMLVDINLPGLPGTWLVESLRADAALKGTRCIALTADARPEHLRELKACGFDDCWTKPIDLRTISRDLRHELTLVAARQDARIFAFDDPDVFDKLEGASDALVDALEFGVIRLNAHAIVTGYNEYESRRAGLSPQRVLGRHFFRDVAVCTDNHLVAGRYDKEAELDATIDYVFAFRMRTTPVRLRLLQRPGHDQRYLLVQAR